MVTIGSTAVTSPELMTEWIETFGSEKIILGADVRDNFISVNGWKEDSRLMLMDFLSEYTKKGIEKVLCTDIKPKTECYKVLLWKLYKSILAGYPSMHLIASGGVSCVNDLTELKTAGLPAAIVGKAFYEGKISLKQLSELNN